MLLLVFILPTIPMSTEFNDRRNREVWNSVYLKLLTSSSSLRQVIGEFGGCMHRPWTLQHIWIAPLQKQPCRNASVLSWGKVQCTYIIFNSQTSQTAENIVSIYKYTDLQSPFRVQTLFCEANSCIQCACIYFLMQSLILKRFSIFFYI